MLLLRFFYGLCCFRNWKYLDLVKFLNSKGFPMSSLIWFCFVFSVASSACSAFLFQVYFGCVFCLVVCFFQSRLVWNLVFFTLTCAVLGFFFEGRQSWHHTCDWLCLLMCKLQKIDLHCHFCSLKVNSVIFSAVPWSILLCFMFSAAFLGCELRANLLHKINSANTWPFLSSNTSWVFTIFCFVKCIVNLQTFWNVSMFAVTRFSPDMELCSYVWWHSYYRCPLWSSA